MQYWTCYHCGITSYKEFKHLYVPTAFLHEYYMFSFLSCEAYSKVILAFGLEMSLSLTYLLLFYWQVYREKQGTEQIHHFDKYIHDKTFGLCVLALCHIRKVIWGAKCYGNWLFSLCLLWIIPQWQTSDKSVSLLGQICKWHQSCWQL